MIHADLGYVISRPFAVTVSDSFKSNEMQGNGYVIGPSVSFFATPPQEISSSATVYRPGGVETLYRDPYQYFVMFSNI